MSEERDNYCDDCDDWGSFACPHCDGTGMVMVCPDDLCRGAGECFHRGGMRVCGYCKGEGEIDCHCQRHAAACEDQPR